MGGPTYLPALKHGDGAEWELLRADRVKEAVGIEGALCARGTEFLMFPNCSGRTVRQGANQALSHEKRVIGPLGPADNAIHFGVGKGLHERVPFRAVGFHGLRHILLKVLGAVGSAEGRVARVHQGSAVGPMHVCMHAGWDIPREVELWEGDKFGALGRGLVDHLNRLSDGCVKVVVPPSRFVGEGMVNKSNRGFPDGSNLEVLGIPLKASRIVTLHTRVRGNWRDSRGLSRDCNGGQESSNGYQEHDCQMERCV